MHVDASLKAKSPPSCGLFYCPKGMLNSPLDYNELKGIAKSIARWVWNKDGEAQARFSAVQAHRGKLGDSSPGLPNFLTYHAWRCIVG